MSAIPAEPRFRQRNFLIEGEAPWINQQATRERFSQNFIEGTGHRQCSFTKGDGVDASVTKVKVPDRNRPFELNCAAYGIAGINGSERFLKDLARREPQMHEICHDSRSFYRDQVTERVKTFLADAAHHHQVLGATERPVLLAMLDDALGEAFTDSGKCFEIFRRRPVDVDLRRS